MQETRGFLESEADRLGVPWTYTTTDAELQALIASRNHGGPTMANGAEESNEQCHGLFWDYPRAKECKACSGHQSCFQKFVETTFPETVNQLGEHATLPQIAKALDVSEEAVLLAKNQQRQVVQPPPIPQPAPVTSVPEPEQDDLPEESLEEFEDPEAPSELDFSDADELEDELEAQPESEAITEVEEPVAEPEPEPPAQENEAMAVKKKAPAKKKAAKKKASKKAPKKTTKKASASKEAPKPRKKKAAKAPPPVTSEVQNPTPAESAKPVTGSVKSKARTKSAPRAKGQASNQSKSGGNKKYQIERPPADPWGPQTWPDRYLKERRNKWIAKLRPGMKIKKKYKGELHEVKVLKRYYRYKDETYPTLYMIVKEITGTKEALRQLDKEGRRPQGTRQLCAWSAPRFFALPALFSKP